MKLKIENLSKRYGAFDALKPTSLDVAEGEFLTLLGPSGSGKTTLLTMIAGLTPPNSGEIYINGRRATNEPAFYRDIGMVFQNYALFPHLSIAENLAFPLRMRKMPEADIRDRVKSMLEIISLPHVAERVPKELSGGQQQRVALARAMVYRPSIVLMDEPLGALDKNLREQMQIEIKHLHKRLKTTIIYVTHDQEEALAMSDRICLMNGGEIEQLAPPNEIYDRPSTVFAANFIGQSNIMAAGEVSDASGNVTPMQAGTRLMVRPEYVRVNADVVPAHHRTEATFIERINIGPTTRYFFKSASDRVLSALVLNAQAPHDIENGQRCILSWAASRSVEIKDVGT
ncbi:MULTISPECIES: ABC transporter ATP-binding protein [Bradyrhizobium]|uniref:Polyamine-transporting ATPase n=3 Tax=Bradyrhizobium TaxID=374 RepID=A0A410VJ25_9BRAD|nr:MULTISPECIES: ABC transporter ATP-binding protein [Bradyrhizobium]MCG2629394.1 ABC transporter ATP-binding protein [Bradyrhizobium zhengyangense]MCG2644675.1 ABC transporter ATP-binding protein [Bradyrhizobium zhengyangense]MCG2670908.1 ABC transporter ATP-binding protein [Bradyrhizobium zhengyangense]MDN4984541.1 ABC transporter ATP-binding protein [Bradyrhizobium sp. WYCCWR 13022]MDN5002533.1 ABC transporter ATP-binding protein [Bradyrhizobium sp. WYCCWR 12677]